MGTVFVITSGRYAEYRVEGIFTHFDAANAFHQDLGDPDAEITEMIVNTTYPHPYRASDMAFPGNSDPGV